jgi:uncharacterized protein (TIGR03118 family)
MIGVRFHNVALVGLTTALFAAGCGSDNDINEGPGGSGGGPNPGDAEGGAGSVPNVEWNVIRLVTNETDPDLINPWGICGMQGLFFMADNGTGKISVYDGGGRTSPNFPTGALSLGEGITGISCNPGAEINVFPIPCETTGQSFGPAQLVVASENGTLIAANAQTPPEGVVVVDLSATGAVFKGVTRVDTANGPVLLAADFANGRVDIFDTNFKLINPVDATGAPTSSAFLDPDLPAGWGPFNVQTLPNGRVYVMEAKISEEAEEVAEEEKGAGLGAVAIFDNNGVLLARLTSDRFNAPWGIAIAPASSALTDGVETLYVGNFGDGRITAFETSGLRELGQLTDGDDQFISIDGLWGLVVGTADTAGSTDAMYFTAGPLDETAGFYGRFERH